MKSSTCRLGLLRPVPPLPFTASPRWYLANTVDSRPGGKPGYTHDADPIQHAYWALGNTPFAREAAYLALLESGLAASQQKSLVDSALNGWALGSATFLEEIQAKTVRRVTRSQPGRPRKAQTDH